MRSSLCSHNVQYPHNYEKAELNKQTAHPCQVLNCFIGGISQLLFWHSYGQKLVDSPCLDSQVSWHSFQTAADKTTVQQQTSDRQQAGEHCGAFSSYSAQELVGTKKKLKEYWTSSGVYKSKLMLSVALGLRTLNGYTVTILPFLESS